MNPQTLLNMFMQGQFRNHPLMATVNQMMAGKNPEQQMQTILNMAKSQGLDINAKIITKEQLKQLGLNIPQKSD